MVVNIVFYTNAVKVLMVYNNGDDSIVIPYSPEIMDNAIDLFTDWYEDHRDIIKQHNIDFSMDIRNYEII